MRKISAGVTASLFLVCHGSAQAGTYQAMFGETKCTVENYF